LRGSIGASIGELEAVLALTAEGNLTPVLEEADFEDLPAALTCLRAPNLRRHVCSPAQSEEDSSPGLMRSCHRGLFPEHAH